MEVSINMRFERVKRSHLKRNIIIGVFVVFVFSAIIINFTRAKYRVTQSIPLVSGTINYSKADLNLVAMYQANESGGYDSIDAMPASGYVINEEKSYCEVSGEKDSNAKLYTNSAGEHVVGNLKKGSKCYLYFDETAASVILAGKTISSSRSSSITGALTGDEDVDSNTIYTTKDDWGTSYFFAGLPKNNWVSFAGHYWRIIRINGDGSIRLIYSGTGSPQTSGEGTQIQTSVYNSSFNDNAYVGYMYGTTGASSYSDAHANTNSSTIKGILDTWYQSNLASYKDKISTEAGFCNDREPRSGVYSSGYGTLGYGTKATAYAPLGRLMSNGSWKTTQTPSLKCSQSNDLFTVSSSSKENKKLTNPIGLITSDEVVFAGGFGGSSNRNYYLNTGEYYWTMSPVRYRASNSSAGVFFVFSDGTLDATRVDFSFGVRPVINLKADIKFTGSGTVNDPYLVVA